MPSSLIPCSKQEYEPVLVWVVVPGCSHDLENLYGWNYDIWVADMSQCCTT